MLYHCGSNVENETGTADWRRGMSANSRSRLTVGRGAAGVLVAVLSATVIVGAGQSPAQPAVPAGPATAGPAPAASTPPPGDDKNAATYTRVCSTCHDAQRILSNRRTRDQWGEVIDKMVERGAQGTDDDFAAVL